LIFSLGTWPPQIPTGFHRTPWYLGTNYRCFSFRVRAFHPLWKTIPDLSARKNTSNIACPATPSLATWFRLLRFRSPLLTESLMIYFPGVHAVPSQTLLAPLRVLIPVWPTSKAGQVTPFGNRWIKGLWHLPNEYRRRMRPSSVKASKASIIGIISRLKRLLFTFQRANSFNILQVAVTHVTSATCKTVNLTFSYWWTVGDSNSLPLHCK
jgi:hypothetical protein